MMAKWRTAFSMGQTDVTRLADQINALTNAYGGNATAVSGIVTRIGALGEVAGVTARKSRPWPSCSTAWAWKRK